MDPAWVTDDSGLAGGHPGSTGLDAVVRGENMAELPAGGTIPQSLDEFGAEVEIGAYAQLHPASALQ